MIVILKQRDFFVIRKNNEMQNFCFIFQLFREILSRSPCIKYVGNCRVADMAQEKVFALTKTKYVLLKSMHYCHS